MGNESDSPQRVDACGLHARESQRLQPDRTPEPPSTPAEGTTQDGCTPDLTPSGTNCTQGVKK